MPVAISRSLSPDEQGRKTKRVKLASEMTKRTPSPEQAGSTVIAERVDDISNDQSEEQLVEEQMNLPIEHPKKYEQELDYREKLVLAPMVRTGSLPMPKPVSLSIIKVKVQSSQLIPLKNLIVGSSNPELAVKAAQTVQQDVAGITHSGMGAALLTTPDILLNILRALLDTINLPISCKIRLLPTQPSTLYLASRILRTGIRNLTVHCRTRDMRSGERALWERLGDIVALGKRRGVPIICNGDGEGWANWENIRTATARSAERNPSIFLPTGPVCNLTQVIPKLIALAEYTKNPWGNTKFLLMQFKPSPAPISHISKSERKKISEVVSRSKSLEEVAKGLELSVGRGEEVFNEIASKIAIGRGGNIFEKRHVAEQRGETIDEATTTEADAQEDGFEVGVGQAQVCASST
ncbi:hypothetical protein IAR55_005008 [Kwoniella newhampshirensis]|uniref:DUS-like FMN-binding domain-containing protein n=1 Tax=Kwoniella newhampshirensis TaxID=1651941 RepID=A0AAW0YZZ4_9TREE